MGRAEDLFQRLIDQGEKTIDDFILDRQSEELFLDFKRSADDGSGMTIHQNDRQNLANAISGFGNSEGGVIVWGVDCRNMKNSGDVAGAKVPIHNPKRFKSWLEGAVSGCTVPPHSLVTHVTIEQASKRKGFVATLIPKSYLAPHQCLKPLQYYIRAGSSFVPTPHAVLQGMFGRRPQPSLFNMWTIIGIVAPVIKNVRVEFNIRFEIYNNSPVIARDIYINATLIPPKGGSKIRVIFPDNENWNITKVFGVIYNLVSKDSYKLAPEARVQPIVFKFYLTTPFESELSYSISFGCHGSQINKIEHKLKPESLKKALEEFFSNNNLNEASEKYIKIVLGL